MRKSTTPSDPDQSGRVKRFLRNARKALSWRKRSMKPATRNDNSPALLPSPESASPLQQEANRQIEWWLNNLPSPETVCADVASALNASRPADGDAQSEFTRRLFQAFDLSAPPGPAKESHGQVRISLQRETDLRRIYLAGSPMKHDPKSSTKAPLCDLYLADLALILSGEASDKSSPFFAVPCIFTVSGPSASAERHGSTTTKNTVEAQRRALRRCIVQCLLSKKLGGSGLGIAIVGDSFSRVWAINEGEVVVEAAEGSQDGERLLKELHEPCGDNSAVAPIFATKFLIDRQPDQRTPLQPSDIDVDAVQRFISFVKTALLLSAQQMGPEGPRA